MTPETDRTYKAAIGVRGDCLYCPLPLSIDSYWNCETHCWHCPFRRLNRTWGTDLRPADPEQVEKKLQNGLKNKRAKSTLACALLAKKTVRLGSRSDPYQNAEKTHTVSRRIQQALIRLEWTYVLQTRFLSNLQRDEGLLRKAARKELVTVMPVISPGAETDWDIFERRRTTPIPRRLRLIQRWIKHGIPVGVNGEPFIPGYHTPKQFRDIIRRLKSVGVRSYNTYNLHLNDYVAKNLHEIGVDIERIWYYNQDKHWRPILQQLLDIALNEDIVLGCPDFVNTGWGWRERANTCCGIDVQNPSRFNTHQWKRMLQKEQSCSAEALLIDTWEGIGERTAGKRILTARSKQNFTMKDIIK